MSVATLTVVTHRWTAIVASFPKPSVGLVVANIKSQIKRNKQNEKRRVRNKDVRTELKTRIKAVVASAEAGGEDLEDAVKIAVKRIDKAATKGIIHKNAAARRKSRLMKRLANTGVK